MKEMMFSLDDIKKAGKIGLPCIVINDGEQIIFDYEGKKVLIQYFALRNSKDEYKGVLEVSQDITEISELEGEKRLLEW